MSLCSGSVACRATGKSVRSVLQSCSRRHSHVGARPIPLPSDVICSLYKPTTSTSTATGETMLRFAGPLGVRELRVPAGISPVLQKASLSAEQKSAAHSTKTPTTSSQSSSDTISLVLQCHEPDNASSRSSWGLTTALAANCVEGVHKGFDMQLQLVGVGYRASVEGQDAADQQQTLVLRLGYPRPLRIAIPAGMQCEVPAPTQIKLSGNDKAALAQLAAKIRSLRPPEPYNGKGVFVNSETIQRKEVKKK